MNRLIDSAPEYWRPAFLVLFTVAPRRSELFGLELKNLNLEEHTLLIRYQLHKGRLVEPKSDAAVRRVVLPARTVEALRTRLATVPDSELGLLFPTERGRPVNPDTWFHRVWQPTREAAGMPDLRIHDARHHLASLLLSQGRSVKYVQRTMGHATASILLDVYAWVTRHEEEEAMSDLDRWMGEEEPAEYGSNPGIRVTPVTPEAECRCLAA